MVKIREEQLGSINILDTDGYGTVNANNSVINNLSTPIENNDAVNKSYVDINHPTLSKTLNIGNDADGYDILNINFITAQDGYFNNDLEIIGKLTVGGLIDPTGIILNNQYSKPGEISYIGKTTIWTNIDGYLVVSNDFDKEFIISENTLKNPTMIENGYVAISYNENLKFISGENDGYILTWNSYENTWESRSPRIQNIEEILTYNDNANGSDLININNFISYNIYADDGYITNNLIVRDVNILNHFLRHEKDGDDEIEISNLSTLNINKYLCLRPNGSGGVEWCNDGYIITPNSTTNNAIIRWNGINGYIIKNSNIIIDDDNNLSGINSITAIDGYFTNFSINGKMKTALDMGNYSISNITTIGSTYLTTTAREATFNFGSNDIIVGDGYVKAQTGLQLYIDNSSELSLNDTQFYPTTDSHTALGTTDLRWADLYSDAATITTLTDCTTATISTLNINTGIYPDTDGGAVLGSTTKHFTNLYAESFNIDNTTVNASTSVYITCDDGYYSILNLGSVGNTDNNVIYSFNSATPSASFIRFRVDDSYALTLYDNILHPYSNNLLDLGASSFRWNNIYGTILNLNGAISGVTTIGSTYLTTTTREATFNFGSNDIIIGDGYVKAQTSLTTYIGSIKKLNLTNYSLYSYTSNELSLGTPLNYWMDGYFSRITMPNNISIGNEACVSSTIAGLIGIGYQAAKLSTVPAIAIGYQTLSSNTTGAANIGIGYYALKSNATGIGNIAIGHNAGNLITSSYNISIGYKAAELLSSGAESIAIGYSSLSKVTTGTKNTSIGYGAGANTTSSSNTFIGNNTCIALTSGTATAVGYNVLSKVTTAVENTAMGYGAGANAILTSSYNTLMGYSVCQTLQTGDKNTAIGNNSLFSLSTGSRNTSLGFKTGYFIHDGYDNVAIGYDALYNNTNSVNRISNNVAIGSFSGGNIISNGNTLIGFQAGDELIDGYNNTAIGYNAFGSTTSYFNSTCIGANSIVSGSCQIQLGDSTTTTYVYGAVQDRSDIRDKADVRNTVLGLKFINKLRPVDFKWDYREDYIVNKDNSKKRNRYHHGLIAQEVKLVCDELGVDFGGYQDHSINNGRDIKTLGYSEFISVLIKAVQEQQIIIENLKTRIQLLEEK
jgi:hypothetical protein